MKYVTPILAGLLVTSSAHVAMAESTTMSDASYAVQPVPHSYYEMQNNNQPQSVPQVPTATQRTASDTHAAAGVNYLSGGVGKESSEEMKAAKGDYNTHLTFAAKENGAYLSDVDVIISSLDGRQRYIEANNVGPMFYADLPRDNYKVTTKYGGVTKTQTIKAGTPNNIVMTWDTDQSSKY